MILLLFSHFRLLEESEDLSPDNMWYGSGRTILARTPLGTVHATRNESDVFSHRSFIVPRGD